MAIEGPDDWWWLSPHTARSIVIRCAWNQCLGCELPPKPRQDPPNPSQPAQMARVWRIDRTENAIMHATIPGMVVADVGLRLTCFKCLWEFDLR